MTLTINDATVTSDPTSIHLSTNPSGAKSKLIGYGTGGKLARITAAPP